MEPLKVIPAGLLADYQQQVDEAVLQVSFDNLKDAEISTATFSFYTSVSAIASSRIEGEQLEIDSYLKHKMMNVEYEPDLVQKPDDLYRAYIFAQQNQLSLANFFEAHRLLTDHLLPPGRRGVLRTADMVIMEHQTGRIQFEAAPAGDVQRLTNELWHDIEYLMATPLTYAEVFYFAAFIHLAFVNIHPFDDGNGRAGRLLEKWFIAAKLGGKARYMQSELNYYNSVATYYKNLNSLGIFYEHLDYSKAMPFLLMLPCALDVKIIK